MTIKQIFNTSAELDYPTILPTLDLDFANTKTLDPRITFTRASGGSYVGADGLIKYAGVNEARFDHDPVTGESLGLLIEESRSNLLDRSGEFNLWTLSNINIISDGTLSPDGSIRAIKNIETKTTSLHRVGKSISKSSVATTYTFSIFAKAGERNGFEFGLIDAGGFVDCFANATNGKIEVPALSGSFTFSSYGSIKYPNGWWRFYVTATTTAQSSIIGFYGITINPGGSNRYTGDGVSGLYVWGAQLEVGSFPTSYIPTQASSRTRAADNARIIGRNFSSFYRQDVGTIFCDAKGIGDISGGLTRRYYEFNNLGSGNFRILSGYNSLTSTRLLTVNNAFIQADLSQANQSPFNNNIKTAATFETNYFRFYSNSLSGTTDNFGTLPIVDRLFIGNSGTTDPGVVLNGTIKRFTYWPKRLPESQLQALTS